MPVNLLLCEGGPNSPDVRLLGKLLAGRCEVRPLGPKQGMGERIKVRRESIGKDVVFGLLDGDFLEDWTMPMNRPRPWKIKENKSEVQLGWRWERKEVENYLIDPVIVRRALGSGSPPEEQYKDALERARDEVAVYQAARTALSACRRRFTPLPSAFGPKRGRERHKFPNALDEASCREGINQTVHEHMDTQVVMTEDVMSCFNTYLPDFHIGAVRHQDFLHAFAGKDLLWAMNERLQQWGLGGALAFREKILKGISQTSEDIADWLPEWKALREEVDRA